MQTDVVVIGGGQAGLAISRCLVERGVEHVVLERGRIGERWRSQSWDSLRLLTPNWLNGLPGTPDDPDGFMTAADVVAGLERIAARGAAPVESGVTVLRVAPEAGGWRVETDGRSIRTRSVVIATGASGEPLVPALACRIDPRIRQLTTATYKAPEALPPGGVLVVGASASGVQIAEEIQQSGRPVTLAVGSHTRLPRRYRGRDIFWWLNRLGILDETAADAADLAALRRQPSLQLVGDAQGRSVDLGALKRLGVKLVGRLVGVAFGRAHFDGGLALRTVDAQRRLDRLLMMIDARAYAWCGESIASAERPAPLMLDVPERTVALAAAGIRTVVWATGFRPRYPWLQAPVLDEAGEIVHRGGITAMPGLYALGLRFMRRRSSSFIAGCRRDAEDLAPYVAGLPAARAAA